MSKTKIPWADYTINPVKGLCPMACSYCYARRMYKRFKWNPEIRYNSLEWYKVSKIKQPSRIFVGSTIELFGDWIDEIWFQSILGFTLIYPQHTFIFLTKCPENLSRWSPFPENCYIGASVTNQKMYENAVKYLQQVDAKVKFLSFEPLLNHILLD